MTVRDDGTDKKRPGDGWFSFCLFAVLKSTEPSSRNKTEIECAYAWCDSEAFQKPKLERSVEAEHSFFLEMKRKQTSSDERLYTETGLFVLEKLTLEGIIAANRASA